MLRLGFLVLGDWRRDQGDYDYRGTDESAGIERDHRGSRAGEAGKGFAVVAGEVKDLAQETAKATDEIGRRVDAIQQDSSSAVEAITKMNEVIGRINDYQTTIASAVEEQSLTTGGMSSDLAQAASGSEHISQGLASVVTVAGLANAGASAARQAATDLRTMSNSLSDLIAGFKH